MVLFALFACDTAPDAPVLEDTVPYVDGELLVKFHDDVGGMEVEDENGLEEAERIEAIGVKRVRIPEGKSVRSVIEKLSEDHRVEIAEPNLLVRGQASDPYAGYQWHLSQMRATEAQAYGTGSGVVVAVLDTGVRTGGPDGIANVLAGYDFYYGDSNPSDGNGHGTFVASEIAQKTGNGVGVAGVAPGASILPVKVLGDDGMGDVSAIANGIVWAADQGADVINMSLGSAYSSSTLKSACDYAYGKGSVLIAATGNEYATSIGYPAAYSSVIAVGATGYGGYRAGYSNRGTGIDLVAPGGDMSADKNGDGYPDGILQETYENGAWTYTFYEGTSMATPLASAAAALVVAQGVTSPAEVASILTSTAKDRGTAGYDTSYGYGEVDATAAVLLARGGGGGSTTTEPEPAPEEEPPTSGSDTTAPTISNVDGYTQGKKFTILWTTNEPADSYVNFSGIGTYGDATLTTSHSLTFTGSRGTTYTFTIESTDAAGNTATDGEWEIAL
ncbi:MAG: S8 family serine peptidase [Myxococcota bacterium]